MFVKTMLITTIWIILYDVLCKQKAGHCPTSHAVAVSFVPIQVLFDFLFDFPLPFWQKAADSFYDRNIRILG